MNMRNTVPSSRTYSLLEKHICIQIITGRAVSVKCPVCSSPIPILLTSAPALTFEWSSEGWVGVSHLEVMGKRVPGSEIHECSYPENGTCLACLGKISVTMSLCLGRWGADGQIREISRVQSWLSLMNLVKRVWILHTKCDGKLLEGF